jgi:hypothetical protein
VTGAAGRASDAARRRLGFFTVEETARLAEGGVLVLDPFSTLVSPGVEIAEGAVLYPGVALCRATGGRIVVGAGAEIGFEGGFSASAEEGEVVLIGTRARLTGGGAIQGSATLGEGTQILGRIAVRACTLEGGGDHTEPDPDQRGAVLKGFGQARNLTLERGRVIQAFGIFDPAEERWQSSFHPPPP